MTAIEYLIKNMPNISELSDNKKRKIEKVFLKAKEMEREQIIDAWYDGIDSTPERSGQQYFNETFKKWNIKQQ